MNTNFIYRDGHIHSHFCPHASTDPIESYVLEAIQNGLHEITFTEHMPFPCYFLENKKLQDESATHKEDMLPYFKAVQILKRKYIHQIKINSGIEVDFIEGLEEQTTTVLNEYGSYIEDGLLSVHVIKIGDRYTPIDWKKGFEEALAYYGSVEAVYDKYYETLLRAVESDLGKFKPNRIGHPNLIRIFQELYPITYTNYALLDKLAKAIKERNYEVDVNTAGLRKPHCHEIYVSDYFYNLVKKYKIDMVLGSDAHAAKDVGFAFSKLSNF